MSSDNKLNDDEIIFYTDNCNILIINNPREYNIHISNSKSIKHKTNDGICKCITLNNKLTTHCKVIYGKTCNIFVCFNCFRRIDEIKDRKEKIKALNTIALSL